MWVCFTACKMPGSFPLLRVLLDELCILQVFLSHLHSDHHADLASLYVNAMFGRKVPLEIWGPSSEKPELGLAASMAGLRQVSPFNPSLHHSRINFRLEHLCVISCPMFGSGVPCS